MIISASRRTDIPAFYGEWFMNRIRAGSCDVPNPFNPNQISHVSLKPEDVDVIVFWTRHGLPMLAHLDELDHRGFPYYFLYTVMNNPRAIDPKSPPLEASLKSFRRLARRIGTEKLVWRYDPILFTASTDMDFHIRTYRNIARKLKGSTHRSIISLATLYRKVKSRLRALEPRGTDLQDTEGEWLGNFMKTLSHIANENDMEIVSCAQESDFTPYGVPPGKCIDDNFITRVFGVRVTGRQDPFQRKACGCVVSKDIGTYNTCLFGCLYCYATTSFDTAKANFKKHDPWAARLVFSN